MEALDLREWLLTNGLGSFAAGTVCDAGTRTYHGWLIAALDPPGQRTLLLSHLDASLEIAGQSFDLGTHFWKSGAVSPLGYQLLQSFTIEPVPTWIWGQNAWQLRRRLILPHIDPSFGHPTLEYQVLIEYHYTGPTPAILTLRPLIADRDFHHQQQAQPDFHFVQQIGQKFVRFQGIRKTHPGTPWYLRWSAGEYHPDGFWYWQYLYPEETQRGLGDSEDLYSPGQLTVTLQPGETVILEARILSSEAQIDTLPALLPDSLETAVQAEQQRLEVLFGPLAAQNSPIYRQLLNACDQFIVYRASTDGPTVIAGYPWFNDWGRDTLIALPGLTLSTSRFALAKGLLETFARYCQNGLIPNAFPDAGNDPFYNSLDATLWWIETLGLYLEATQDWEFLAEKYPIVRRIYKTLSAGTWYHIQVDATDGLLMWDAPGVALTWMDAVIDGQPITPRRGKPVEINALWYSALCWAAKWAQQLAKGMNEPVKYTQQAQIYTQKAQKVQASFSKFWNPKVGYLYDTIDPEGRPSRQIRPNAIIALSLHHCPVMESQAHQVLNIAKERLLTPYGLRSLDPADPEYIGKYAGDRWHRDRAYHQGTVWSWLIGPFIRAWQRFYPHEPVPVEWQPWIEHIHQQACLGSVSEIFDGDAPHLPQGAFAQAWSVAELIRHWPRS